MKYFFDTYALVEIIKENPNYGRFKGEDITTSILNIGELYYSLLKNFGGEKAELGRKKFEQTAFGIDLNDVISGIKFRYANMGKNLSYVDCISYSLARERKLIFVTGDKDFENIENVEFVK